VSEHPTATNPSDEPVQRRPRATDFDRQLGMRIRQRRIMLGLTQQQMAELIGVTYQQAHKYKAGINRVSAARLLTICDALAGWSMADALTGLGDLRRPSTSERRRLEIVANAAKLDKRKAAGVAALVRVLAGEAEGDR
jgi:transcriptional regulator with XRE-family HTH domain